MTRSRWRGRQRRRAGARRAQVRQEDHRAGLRLRRHALAQAHAGVRLPAQDRRRPGRVLGREQSRWPSSTQADPLITYMHLLYKKAQEKGVRIDRRDLVAQGRLVELFPGVEAWFDRVGDYVKTPRAEPRRGAAPLPDLLGSHRDHRGHLDLQALPQRVRLRILVRGLRPALPQARHHRHRQDAVPLPHQQGRGGPGREHQPAHARGTRGPSRSPT